MTDKNMKVKRLILRNDKSRNWEVNNPKLFSGEIGIETDTQRVKIGNGIDKWNDLGYVIDPVNGKFKGRRINGVMFDGSKDIEVQANPYNHIHSMDDVDQLNTYLKKLEKNILDKAHGELEDIEKDIIDRNEIDQLIRDEISKAEDRFFQELQYQLGKIEEDIKNGILSQEEAHKRLDEIIEEVDKHIHEELEKELEEIQKELEDAHQRLDAAIEEAKKHIYDEIIKEIENAKKELGQASEDVRKEIEEAKNRLDQALKDAHAEIDATIKNQIDDIKKQLEDAKTDIDNTNNRIDGAIQDTEDRLNTQIQEQLDSIKQEIESGYITKQEVEQQIQNAVTNAENSLKGTVEEIRGSMTDKINGIITELNKAPEESGYKSINQLQKTATSLSNTIATNKQTQDGINEIHLSQIQQTQNGVETIVANLNKDAAGNEYKAIADLKIQADQIKSTVTQNKNDTDKSLSTITQRADSIETLVAQNKNDTDKSLSQITQKADSIAALVEKNKDKQDGVNEKFTTWIRQNAESIGLSAQKIEDELNKDSADCRYKSIAHLNIKANEISSIVATEKRDNEQRHEEAMSKITQTANSIKATIQQNKHEQDGINIQTSTQIEQTGNSIQGIVNGLNADAKGNRFGSIASLSMRADEINSTVARNKSDTDKAVSSLTQKADSIISMVNTNRQIQENKNEQLGSLIEQKAGEVNVGIKKVENELNKDGTQCSYKSISSINAKADQISSTVQTTNQRMDGVEDDLSRVEQKADAITLTVSKLQSDQYGDKLQLSSSIKQAADRIEANLNKTSKDNPYAAISSLYVTAEKISSTVAQHKEENDKNNKAITDEFSQIKQTSNSIQLLVESNQKAQDVENKRLASLIQQGPSGVNVVVEQLERDYNDCEYNAISSLKIKANGIASAVEENRTYQDGKNEELRSLIKQSSGGVDGVIEELNKDGTETKPGPDGKPVPVECTYKAISKLKARADGIDITVGEQGKNINTALSKVEQNAKKIETVVVDLGNQNLEELGNKYKAFSAIVQRGNSIESTVTENVTTSVNAGLNDRINNNIDAKVNDYDRKLQIEKFSKITQEAGRISALVESNREAQDKINSDQRTENQRLAALIEAGPEGLSATVEEIKRELNKDGSETIIGPEGEEIPVECTYKAISSLKLKSDELRINMSKFQKDQNGINEKHELSISQSALKIESIIGNLNQTDPSKTTYNALSAIVQKADGIEATVTQKVIDSVNNSVDGKIDKKIDSNNKTILEERFSNIEQTANGISQTVSQKVDKSAFDKFTGEQIQENATIRSLIKQGPGGVNVVAEELRKNCDDCSYNAISTLNIKANGISSTVSDVQNKQDQTLKDLNLSNLDDPGTQAALKKYGMISSINQKADSISSTVSDLSQNTSTRFEQTNNRISGVIADLGGKNREGEFIKIANLNMRADGLNSTIGQVEKSHEELTNDLKLSDLTSQDAQNAFKKYGLLSEINQKADGIKTLVADLSQNTSTEFEQTNNKISGIIADLGGKNGMGQFVRIADLQAKADGISSTVSETLRDLNLSNLDDFGTQDILKKKYGMISSINQKADGINSKVSDLSQNTSTRFNQTANEINGIISKLGGENEAGQFREIASLKASANRIDSTVAQVGEMQGAVDKLKADYSTVSQSAGQIQQLIVDVGNVKNVGEKADKALLDANNALGTVNEKVSLIQQNSDGIQNIVAELRKDGSDGTYCQYSAIKQLRDKIDLQIDGQLDGEKVVSAINMTPGEIKLSSKKIVIDGDTVINGKVIKNGMIDNNAVGPNNVQAGAITADKINITGGKTGARIEITENLITVFDTNGMVRVKLGIW